MVLAVHPAGDQRQLGMDLVIVEAVHHRAARILQLLGPVDVVLLVKAGAQFHHGHDLFAVFRRIDQRADDLGVAGHAVQRHLDGNDVGIRARAQQHTNERADALVRVSQENVVLAYLGVQVIPGGSLHRLGRRVEHFRVAAVPGDPRRQLEQAAGVQRRSLRIAAGRRNDQLVPQEFGDLLRGFRPELQADRRQFAALLEQFTHHVAEVDVVVHHALVHRDVGVAGHAEQAFFLDRAGVEDGGRIVGHQFLNKGKAGGLAVADEQHALEPAADRDNAEADAVALVVKLGDVVNVLIVQERERMARVHDLRAEQRQQFPVEVGFPEMFLLFAQLGKIHFFISGVRQLPHKVLEVFIALGLQFSHAGRDGGNLFGRRHVRDHVRLVVLEQRLVVQ